MPRLAFPCSHERFWRQCAAPHGGCKGGPGGPLAMSGSKTRQARKGATVAAAACAGVWLSGPLPGLKRIRYVLSGAGAKMAPGHIRRPGRSGARIAGAAPCAGQRSSPPRLSVYRHARCGQDHHRAHSRPLSQLRKRRQRLALRRLFELPGNYRRPQRRPDRSGRGLAHQGRGHAGTDRQRALRAHALPLQGVPDRRSAHAFGAFLQRPVKNP